VKLQLDNNIIDTIQGLEHLVNLEWLDLSFNNITEMAGLDMLVKLTDLSLFNNKLTQIAGLNQLTKLNVLSVGNNQITDLECIKGLRKFEHLRLLNMTGNPVCANADYQNTVFAFLTKLTYLDYVMIEPGQVVKARDSKLDKLLDLEAREKTERAEKEEEKKAAERLALMEQANLGGVGTLVDIVCQEDDQFHKLKLLPGYEKILVGYREKVDEIVSPHVDAILVRHGDKMAEKSLFEGAIAKFSLECETKSVDKIQAFEAHKKKVLADYENVKEVTLLEGLKVEVAALREALMDTEMVLVETLEDVFLEFEQSYAVFVSQNVQALTECFSQCAEVCGWYSKSLNKLVQKLLEEFANENSADEDNPEVTKVLSDRDTLNSSVGTSTDNHTGRIMQKGDEMGEQEDSRAKGFVREARQDEFDRNRYRVSEIQALIRSYNATIDQMYQDSLDQDAFDDN
jgi:hypothetical protein